MQLKITGARKCGSEYVWQSTQSWGIYGARSHQHLEPRSGKSKQSRCKLFPRLLRSAVWHLVFGCLHTYIAGRGASIRHGRHEQIYCRGHPASEVEIIYIILLGCRLRETMSFDWFPSSSWGQKSSGTSLVSWCWSSMWPYSTLQLHHCITLTSFQQTLQVQASCSAGCCSAPRVLWTWRAPMYFPKSRCSSSRRSAFDGPHGVFDLCSCIPKFWASVGGRGCKGAWCTV